MGLLNSKRSSADEDTGKSDDEKRLATRKQKIAYVNQCISVLKEQKVLPEYLLVRKKKTNLLVDEDGYTAHEFYEQVADQNDISRTRLVPKSREKLRALQFVNYKIPRLDNNLNLVLWQAE
uniref:RasGAP_C domain-containing protein n=1 Tax=Steinernema glaseri TaxID=37863 RepID=A0A1I7YM19_9BILA